MHSGPYQVRRVPDIMEPGCCDKKIQIVNNAAGALRLLRDTLSMLPTPWKSL